MLKNSGVDIVYKIVRYTPDTAKMSIDVEIETGSNVDGAFVSDGRGLVKHRIENIPDRAVQQTDDRVVDAAGQITLSRMPIDNNPLEVESVVQDHVSGQVVTCSGYSENDPVTVKYYYNKPGHDWFKRAAEYRQVDHPECIGMNDYEYNSYRIWSILVEMGLMAGAIV